MCEFSGRLIAWLDRDLPDQEATNIAWHVGRCADCRKAVSAYQDISAAFLDCYEAALLARRNRQPWGWIAGFSGIAAATILFSAILVSRRSDTLPIHPPDA